VSEEPEPMAYIARKACGCFAYAGVDIPKSKDGNAKEIVWAIDQGYIVERVTCAYVREHWRSECATCTPVQQEALPL